MRRAFTFIELLLAMIICAFLAFGIIRLATSGPAMPPPQYLIIHRHTDGGADVYRVERYRCNSGRVEFDRGEWDMLGDRLHPIWSPVRNVTLLGDITVERVR